MDLRDITLTPPIPDSDRMTCDTIPSPLSVLSALAGLAFIDSMLHTVGFAWLRRRLLELRPVMDPAHANVATVAIAITTIERAAMYYPRRALCLQRSLLLTWLLRRRGVPVQVVIGCRPIPFYAHAWVELAGLVVNDRQSVKDKYAELERF